MKNFLTTILFATLLFISSSVSVYAYYYSDIGTYSNPLYFELKESKLDQTYNGFQQQRLLNAINTQTQAIKDVSFQAQINNLQNSPRCDSQYREASDLYRQQIGKMDLMNPANASMYDSYTNYLKDSYLTCLKNDQRDTQNLEQSCKNDFGVYSKLGSIDLVNRKYSCACQPGYTLSSYGNSCVAIQEGNTQSGMSVAVLSEATCMLRQNAQWNATAKSCDCLSGYERKEAGGDCSVKVSESLSKTNDQICQESWQDSKWGGTKNDKGALVCGCVEGYQWNEKQTACVTIPKKETPPATPTVVIKKAQEVKIANIKSGVEENTASSTTNTNNEWRNPAYWNSKVASSTAEVRRKGLWSRIKGWFGF